MCLSWIICFNWSRIGIFIRFSNISPQFVEGFNSQIEHSSYVHSHSYSHSRFIVWCCIDVFIFLFLRVSIGCTRNRRKSYTKNRIKCIPIPITIHSKIIYQIEFRSQMEYFSLVFGFCYWLFFLSFGSSSLLFL